MPTVPPSSAFRLRNASPRQVGATRRVLVSTQRVAHAPRVPFDAPRVEFLSPNDRDEALRTTREGACAPPPPSSSARHCHPLPAASTLRSTCYGGRAGWVGCNFALNRIPLEARIPLVVMTITSPRRSGVHPPQYCYGGRVAPDSDLRDKEDGDRQDACPTVIVPPEEVREKFKRVKPLGEIKAKERGWTLDVLNIVRRLVDSRRRGDETPIGESGFDQSLLTSSPTEEFKTANVYAFTRELEKLHPDNSDSHREQAGTSAITP